MTKRKNNNKKMDEVSGLDGGVVLLMNSVVGEITRVIFLGILFFYFVQKILRYKKS